MKKVIVISTSLRPGSNSHAMVEALVFNFDLQPFAEVPQQLQQMELQFA